MTQATDAKIRPRGGVPRGLAKTGPVLFSYGFRPFFLGGALWACLSMALWIMAVSGRLDIGGEYGAVAWHAHEMLFGFGSAIVAGFLLTAVPNWTGRLPVSGWPLAALFGLWLAGRVVMSVPEALGILPSVALEAIFLPTMLVVCVREIVVGQKWADLKVVGGLGALTIANICFHYETLELGGPDRSERLALAGLTIMIVVVGGRMLPSFTRNWLNKSGRTDFPVPYNRFDLACIVSTLPALGLWIATPSSIWTAGAATFSAALHFARLWRWRGWTTVREPLLVILHVAYVLVPGGLVAIAAAALDVVDATAATHVLTVGTVSAMMLAVMTRATRGHTGRELTASAMTCASYIAILLCALVRPSVAIAPERSSIIYAAAAAFWIAAFALYVAEYGPMLVARRKPSSRTV